MAVVSFPDEMHRKLIKRLDENCRFEEYLNAIEYCARKQIDQAPLMTWWQRNHEQMESENFELDFTFFLGKIVVRQMTWEQEKARRQEEARRKEENRSSEEPNALRDDVLAEADHLDRQRRFIKEHPEYRCVDAAERYHQLFADVYGTPNPLTTMGRYLNRFLSCDEAGEAENRDAPGFSLIGSFGYRGERPPAFVIGSPEHEHLMSLAFWVSQKTKRPESAAVFSFSLTCHGIGDFPSEEIMASACSCSHALFSHLMIDREIQLADPGALFRVLQMPLALTAAAAGPPHLTPEFFFIGSVIDTDSCNVANNYWSKRKELALAWKDFFARYRILRKRENGGRAFPRAGNLYRIALASQGWDDFCWTDGEQCIEKSFEVLCPDIFCVLDYLRKWLDNDDLLILDAEESRSGRFSDQHLILPIVREVRSESWYELSSSILCFYLLASAVAASGDLEDLKNVAPEILASRGTPGDHFVTRTIEMVCEIAEKEKQETTFLLFDQFRVTADDRVASLIERGENESCEFKSTLRVNLYTGKPDKKIEHAALKSIAAFLNKKGGSLLLGVGDNGEIIGIEEDRFENADKCVLHLKNLVSSLMPEGVDLVSYRIVLHQWKAVLLVDCKRGRRPTYLKNRETNQEEFYVRRGPSTDCLGVREAVEYIRREWHEGDVWPGL